MSRRRNPKPRFSTRSQIAVLFLCAVGGYLLSGYLFKTQPESQTVARNQQLDPETHYVTFEQKVKPIMERYCYDCHMDGSDKGELDMDRYTSFASMTQDRETWTDIKAHLELKLMPPLDEDQPKPEEISLITQWIDNTIFYTDAENPDPGKVVIRRLNRNEYRNTINDLLGVDIDVERLLPLDDTGYGFDTISDVHTVSSAHIEKYLTAAETALQKATIIGDIPSHRQVLQPDELRYEPSKLTNGHFYIRGSAQLPITTLERVTEGIYELEMEASSTPAGNENAILEVKLDNKSIAKIEIPPGQSTKVFKTKVPLNSQSKLTMSYINDFYDPNNTDPSKRDRNLKLHEVRLIGPTDRQPRQKPATHRAIFPERTASQTPETYAQEVWLAFARKAFRREVMPDEVKAYSQFLNPENGSEEELQEQILLGLQAMLISPHFLYINNDPGQDAIESDEIKVPISEYALASRLSYFLWSSTPDSILLEKAANRQLRENLAEEIDRMLEDPKAERFVKNFGGQWLQLRDLKVHNPNFKLYPQWNKSIRQDAVKETEHFLKHLIQEDVSMLDCLDSDYTFLNENLAKFYDINSVKGNHFRKVILTPEQRQQRGGLLGQASILTLTSYPDRTSPVLRGKWILENIIGTPIPPPPQDIPALEAQTKKKSAPVTLRAQLEEHRKKTECATCHKLLDPLGFALQNYSGIGKWRTRSKGGVIDTTGKLISGEEIQDGAQLRNVLKHNKSEQFMRCLTEKLLTYSTGRGVEYYDKPAIDQILKESATNNHSFKALIHSICRSTPFQMTRTKHYKAP